MGGHVPLGYDIEDRQLLVNPVEMKTVQMIFTQYLTLGNMKNLKQYLDSEGITSKTRINRHGDTTGGNPLSRGGLYKMLNNPIYRGLIRHKDKTYAGMHKSIVDEATWDNVQALLAKNNSAACHGLRAKHPSLLAGKLFDDCGYSMSPSHAVKNSKRYRYYTSQAVLKQMSEKAGSLPRIPAAEVESAATRTLNALITSPLQLSKAIGATVEEMDICKRRAAGLVKKMSGHPDLFRNLLSKVTLSDKKIVLSISITALRAALDLTPPETESALELVEKIQIRRCQGETKLIIADTNSGNTPCVNPPLIKAIARAHAWNQMLMRNEVVSIKELAGREGISIRYVCRLLPLAKLAPDIVETILDGHQHPGLTLNKLCDLAPENWSKQHQSLAAQSYN